MELLAVYFKLSANERNEVLPSGKQAIFENRVGWARFYLTKAGLLRSYKRGVHQISDQGLKFLQTKPNRLLTKDLVEFQQFVDFKASITKKTYYDKQIIGEFNEVFDTPEESLEYAYFKIKNDLSRDLLVTIKGCSALFFEKLVVDLITKMGYGGSRKDAGVALGKSGDGGIDGIINEDKLGLDTIYIQAKKWEGAVPLREIRDFAGALLSKKARKGIFIAISTFPKTAHDFVSTLEQKIILIDGERLTDLMFEFNVGLSTQSVYEVKRIDGDYFEE